eukprot:Pgem_evm1s7319
MFSFLKTLSSIFFLSNRQPTNDTVLVQPNISVFQGTMEKFDDISGENKTIYFGMEQVTTTNAKHWETLRNAMFVIREEVLHHYNYQTKYMDYVDRKLF